MNIADQTRAFLAMTLCGAGVGIAHDLLTVFRRGMLLTLAADMALGVMLCAGVIGAALVLCCEPFRLYTLLGVASGWVIYALSLGTIVRILMKGFAKMSNKFTK